MSGACRIAVACTGLPFVSGSGGVYQANATSQREKQRDRNAG